MDRSFRGNNKGKGQLEQPLLESKEGKKENRSGMWWLCRGETSESKMDLPELKSELLESTKSAFKSFETISDRLKQVKDSYPLTESAHNIIGNLSKNITSIDQLKEHKEYIENIAKNIRKGVNILKRDIKCFIKSIDRINKIGVNPLLIAKDSNKMGEIKKLVNQLPDPVAMQKILSDDIKSGDNLQLMQSYMSCIDVFTKQEYKQHLSDLRELLRTGSSDHEGSTSH